MLMSSMGQLMLGVVSWVTCRIRCVYFCDAQSKISIIYALLTSSFDGRVMSKYLSGGRLERALNDAFYGAKDTEESDIEVAEQVCSLLNIELREISCS